MSSKDQSRKLRELSLSVGDFIRYWGFRRVHGAVWAQLWLSPEPLSCTDLAARLELSKALISPALGELLAFGLIFETEAPDEKVKLYAADPDVNSVIKHVLKTREKLLLEKVRKDFVSVEKENRDTAFVESGRLRQLDFMIRAARSMLDLMLDEEELLELPEKMERSL